MAKNDRFLMLKLHALATTSLQQVSNNQNCWSL